MSERTEHHANDAMGKAAHKAALFAHLLDFRLLAAASFNVAREERAANLRLALAQWPALCRAMGELAAAAPATAMIAEADDAALQDFLERKGAATVSDADAAQNG